MSTYPVSADLPDRPGGANGAGSEGPAPLPFESDALGVLVGMRDAFAALLDGTPKRTSTCTEVEDALGIDAMLAWQVLHIARATDPFECGIKVPTPGAMQKVFRAAAKQRVPKAVIERVKSAFDEYERLVADHGGSRTEFEMLVSSFLPAAKAKAQLAAKHAGFKCMSQVKGVTAEADFVCYFVFPSEQPDLVDQATIEGHIGLRRMRPGAPIYFGTAARSPRGAAMPANLDGSPIDEQQAGIISEFSTAPTGEFKQFQLNGTTYYALNGQDVGMRTAFDLVRGTLLRNFGPRYRIPGGRYCGHAKNTEVPVKRLTVDIFLHEDVYPNASPRVTIHDMTFPLIDTPIRHPELEQFHMLENIEPLGVGFRRTKLAHVPGYQGMLEYVCERIERPVSRFRGFRLDVQYPLYGAQYLTSFELPERPAGPSAG